MHLERKFHEYLTRHLHKLIDQSTKKKNWSILKRTETNRIKDGRPDSSLLKRESTDDAGNASTYDGDHRVVRNWGGENYLFLRKRFFEDRAPGSAVCAPLSLALSNGWSSSIAISGLWVAFHDASSSADATVLPLLAPFGLAVDRGKWVP